MKTLFLTLLLIVGGVLYKPKTSPVQNGTVAEPTIADLKSKRTAADKYLKQHDKDLLLYAKAPGKTKPVKVKDEDWPDEVDVSYNVLKDLKGKVIMILESPFSQTGDWSITYTHYFDDKGNTYAFKMETNVFDDVKGGVVYETQVKYYGIGFKTLAKTYTLLDKYGTKVKNNGHTDVYRYKHSIYKSLKDCLKGYNIKAF